MSQQIQNDSIVIWTFDNYTTLVGFFSGIAVIGLVLYIYYRSGSLMLLRDLMWRFFGGSTKFENSDFERSRKNLREVEHYRFEFNIPAQTLEDATLAENWIKSNSFSHRDVASIKSYIDWSDFNNPNLKTKLFSTKVEHLFAAGLVFFLLLILITPPLASTNYLMVYLRESPDTPSFFISENNAKFSMFSKKPLTPVECGSSTSLQDFIKPGFSENDLDQICNLFLNPNYIENVKSGLKEQRAVFIFIVLLSILAAFCLLVKLTRIRTARKLYTRVESI